MHLRKRDPQIPSHQIPSTTICQQNDGHFELNTLAGEKNSTKDWQLDVIFLGFICEWQCKNRWSHVDKKIEFFCLEKIVFKELGWGDDWTVNGGQRGFSLSSSSVLRYFFVIGFYIICRSCDWYCIGFISILVICLFSRLHHKPGSFLHII